MRSLNKTPNISKTPKGPKGCIERKQITNIKHFNFYFPKNKNTSSPPNLPKNTLPPLTIRQTMFSKQGTSLNNVVSGAPTSRWEAFQHTFSLDPAVPHQPSHRLLTPASRFTSTYQAPADTQYRHLYLMNSSLRYPEELPGHTEHLQARLGPSGKGLGGELWSR